MCSPKQLARIKRLAFDDYADADERTALVHAVETSEELHQVAFWFNYDAFAIREIIDHPQCAKGTAVMLYWCLSPDYVYRQIERKKPLVVELEQRIPLFKEIERRVSEDAFVGDPVAFSPSIIVGRPLRDDDVYRPGIRLVPAWMKVDVKGKNVERARIEEG